MQSGLMCGMAVLSGEKDRGASEGLPRITFYKDVVPILRRSCQTCHRPGEIAPMSLLDYKDTRPFAKIIKKVVADRIMPPWFADSRYGKFSNDRSLPDVDVKTLVSWVDAGAPAGNPKDAPSPVEWPSGWRIGKPDVVYEMPTAFHLPASGTIEYQYVVIPTGFKEDRWIEVNLNPNYACHG